jgi:hypothetical protein
MTRVFREDTQGRDAGRRGRGWTHAASSPGAWDLRAGGAGRAPLPRRTGREPALPHAKFGLFGFQNCERGNFHYFQPPSGLWYFITKRNKPHASSGIWGGDENLPVTASPEPGGPEAGSQSLPLHTSPVLISGTICPRLRSVAGACVCVAVGICGALMAGVGGGPALGSRWLEGSRETEGFEVKMRIQISPVRAGRH